jgi:DNA-binding winged helix-turn-helix (wHTH) protein/Tol biopolymer transport system component
MSTDESRLYEFEGFRLDPTRRLLSGPDSRVISLGPRVFDTLRHLVEHRGQLLDKDALLQAIWGNVVVEENSLNQHISTLRQVLGEKPGENRFIATVPGRGYVFVAQVTLRGASADERPSPVEPPISTEQRPQHVVADRPPLRVLAWVVVGALIATAGWYSLGFRQLPEPAVDTPVVRLSLDLEPGQRLTGNRLVLESAQGPDERPSRASFALSPNGRDFVYAALDETGVRLYRRPLGDSHAVPIAGTEGATEPFFSPDGKRIGFVAGGLLKVVPTDGGDVRTLTVADSAAGEERATPSWTEADTILFAKPDGIFEQPADGGRETQLTEAGRMPTGGRHVYPQMFAGHRAMLFNVADDLVPSRWDIVAESLDGGEPKLLLEGGSHPRYVPGHILFARGGSLLAVPFDAEKLEVTGAPFVVLADVMQAQGGINSNLNSGAAQYSFSSNGTLAYLAGGIYAKQRRSLVWVDRNGAVEPLRLDPTDFWWPRFSPDGAALSYATGSYGDLQIWVYDIALETPTRLTTIPFGHNAEPVWSADSKRLIFMRWGEGLFSVAADGSEEARPILEGADLQPSSVSSADVLAYVVAEPAGRAVWTLALDGSGKAERFTPLGTIARWPDFSWDGKWLAYAENDREAGPQIHVRAFPPAGAPQRISTAGGIAPVWSHDGRELLYLQVDERTQVPHMVSVDVTTAPDFKRSQPRVLFEAPGGVGGPTRSHDISPNGERFVFLTNPISVDGHPAGSVTIVLNGLEALHQRASLASTPASGQP